MYNLATSAVAEVDEEVFAQIQNPESASESVLEVALENGFLVPIEENEVEKVLAVQRMNNYSTRFAGFQILPTTACNARCWYCYEENFEKCSMSYEVARAIPRHLESYMDMVDDVHVTWFGGEPMLEFGLITELSRWIVASCEERGVGYTADMITNASLLTSEAARVLAETCRVSQVQITFDGMGDRHIEKKRYNDRSICFDTILDSIQYLLDCDIRVLIRINADKNNVRDCLQLIGELGAAWADNPSAALYVAPLYGTNARELFLAEDELNELYEIVFKAMIDAGWIRSFDGIPMNFNNATCSARMINNFVIDPKGNLFKCEHLLSDETEIIGNIAEGVEFTDSMARWASPQLPEKCLECGYLPACQGGCYAAEALNFGFSRCPHIAFIEPAIISAADYLLQKQEQR
ncbi:radical SAM/SPASM domain-containing protein [uncultured Adlercreutzia sp.]|uniref:radical SAM/SPASM domain-containing protein n=1 Tax=uncultured Adlercreutzia sp. TaxID=875803 RepID=UPI0026F3CC03|nr:radical SAM protein [uncultured Adlercreutzia sp.]